MKPKLTTRILKYLLITSAVIAVAIALIWIALQGYSAPWTGFGDFTKPSGDLVRGKTLWDWMDLLIVPLVLAGGAFFLNRSERNAEREIAKDKQREDALQDYIKEISKLLLDKKLGKSDESDKEEVRDVARILTISILRVLDPKRMVLVLQFLKEANLTNKLNPIIDLKGTDLSSVDFSYANLIDLNLASVNLEGANLNEAVARGINLSGASLKHATLRKTDLNNANLNYADLAGADLTGAHLNSADLKYVSGHFASDKDIINLSNAELINANLTSADLSHTKLIGAVMHSITLTNTDFTGADLTSADLSGAHVNNTRLDNVNMNRANLSSTRLTEEQLATVKSLKGTIMPDGTKHD